MLGRRSAQSGLFDAGNLLGAEQVRKIPFYGHLAATWREIFRDEDFAEFYYDVCTLDYARMSKAMDPLAELINTTDRVQIKGPGTDLAFSIALEFETRISASPVVCFGRVLPTGRLRAAARDARGR